MANFKKAVDKVIAEEGGAKYTETKGDKGGATKYGISQKAFPNLNIKELTLEQAEAIYKTEYWDKLQGDKIISQRVAECVFDCAVNMGVPRAAKFAQEVAKCKIDGIVGTQSVAYINACEPEKFLPKFLDLRVARYREIVKQDPTQEKFLGGWVARAYRHTSM